MWIVDSWLHVIYSHTPSFTQLYPIYSKPPFPHPHTHPILLAPCLTHIHLHLVYSKPPPPPTYTSYTPNPLPLPPTCTCHVLQAPLPLPPTYTVLQAPLTHPTTCHQLLSLPSSSYCPFSKCICFSPLIVKLKDSLNAYASLH